MALPALALYPPESIRSHLPPEEWQACLDTWISSVQLRLRLTDSTFLNLSTEDAGVPFLLSYLSGLVNAINPSSGSRESTLRQSCYFLMKRILLILKVNIAYPELLLLLSTGSVHFSTIQDWRVTLGSLWKSKHVQLKKAVEAEKAFLSSSEMSRDRLNQFTALTRCLPSVTVVSMAGADYLDTLMTNYTDGSADLQRAITENTYYSFTGLIVTKHIPLLLDNLYHMRSEADRLQKSKRSLRTLLSSLICTTSFLRHLRSNAEMMRRQQDMVDYLSQYRQKMLHIHTPTQKVRRKRSKGKGKASHAEEMHMHEVTLVSQIHDLFPNLSAAYIMKLLDHFSNDVEKTTAALLEPSSLPPHLQDQDVGGPKITQAVPEDLAPESIPPVPQRRKNVFDDDEFDRLQISSSAVQRGKKDVSADQGQTYEEHSRSKAAIMAALARFDADDDERDDTYDVADVGGAVDNTVDTDERFSRHEKHEATLFQAWKDNPEMFARDSKTRMSNLRQQLKRESNMTDEQLEGWAVMLKRDPKMGERLQSKYSAEKMFRGNQRDLESTKWTANASTDNSEAETGGEASDADTRRMGQAGIRGHRHFGQHRGRGGSTTGSSESAETQAARKRKEQGRGRGGANHRRREGRAKKMARGMSAVAS